MARKPGKFILISAPAKINLYLGVHAEKDERGYHRVDSVMTTIDLADVVALAPADELSVHTVPAADYPMDQNSAYRAARAMGASDVRIIARHIFPNSVASIVVYATMNIGGAILTESALSFLGMGVVPPNPSWGTLIQDGQQYLQTEPWLMILPGLAILSTVLAFTLLGDGLRDALDVKMKDA